MKKILSIAALGLLGLAISGCSSPAPKYGISFDNVNEIQSADADAVALGDFTANTDPARTASAISLRAHTMNAPEGDYAAYIQSALRDELKTAELLDPASDTILSGELLRNDVDASGLSVGTADLEMRFVVTESGEALYDKAVSVHHEWESAFAGASAIPAAMDNYPVTVQNLINNLFEDEEFKEAVR